MKGTCQMRSRAYMSIRDHLYVTTTWSVFEGELLFLDNTTGGSLASLRSARSPPACWLTSVHASCQVFFRRVVVRRGLRRFVLETSSEKCGDTRLCGLFGPVKGFNACLRVFPKIRPTS